MSNSDRPSNSDHPSGAAHSPGADRLHALDAVRAFALLLGVIFHAGFSFLPAMIPGLWAIVDRSPSRTLAVLLFASHIFRMSLFFLVAGFFARMMVERRGLRGFWSDRARRIGVPLVAGWVILAPMLMGLWIWGLTITFGGKAPDLSGLPEPPAPPPAAFPLTHLWFLYTLLMLYGLVTIARAIVLSLDSGGAIRRATDTVVCGLVRTGAAAVLLPLPLAAALYARPDWVIWFGIPTPDNSLLPQLASITGFGTAFTFGWLLHRQVELLAVWGRQWPIHLAGALAATGFCLSIAHIAPAFTPIAAGGTKLAYALAYSLAIWCWSFALIGLAIRFLSRPHAATRYVADASYWIYLAHLPVVILFQILVARWPLHWSLKFPLVLAASFAVLFGSYRWLVRSTFIGQLLNGRRYPRGAAALHPPSTTARTMPTTMATALAATTDPSQQAASADDEMAPRAPEPAIVATLERVKKRYGSIEALAGVDLGVREGELLALLGPNGAGKSTAISLWLGLLEPDSGHARLFGHSPLDVAIRRQVGVMMQDVGLTPELRVRELIALTASYYPRPLTVDETLDLTGTRGLANRTYAKLSGGQKRQVQFALAVCGRPPLLFLDEPTVGLDVEAREVMWRTIRAMVAQGGAIVLTTHYLEEAEALADRVAVLAGGRLIASGTVAEIRSLVSRKQITCASTLAVEDVRAWPGVLAVTRDAHRLQITVVDAEDIVRRLLDRDAGLRDLEVRQAGLADAFTTLTREAA